MEVCDNLKYKHPNFTQLNKYLNLLAISKLKRHAISYVGLLSSRHRAFLLLGREWFPLLG